MRRRQGRHAAGAGVSEHRQPPAGAVEILGRPRFDPFARASHRPVWRQHRLRFEVRAHGEIIILDAGTGLRPLGRELMTEFKDQPLNLTLLLSHTHWDHIQGLPFFPPIYLPHCRMRILGFEGARRGLVNVLTGQMESPYFPVPFGELPGNIEVEELKDMEFQGRPGARSGRGSPITRAFASATACSPIEGSLAFFPDNETHCRYDADGQRATRRGQRCFARVCARPGGKNDRIHPGRGRAHPRRAI